MATTLRCLPRLCISLLVVMASLATGGCLGSGESDKEGDNSSPAPSPAAEPRIASVSPSETPAGGPDLTVTVQGSGFDAEGHQRTYVVWSVGKQNTLLRMSDATSTRATVTVPATLLTLPVTADVFVQNYDPMSDAELHKSNPVHFIVSAPRTQPATSIEFTSIGPMSVAREDHTATLLDNGEVLVAGADASAELFDPADAAFVPTGSLSGDGRGIAAVRLQTGRVLVVGGATPDAELYDPTVGAFTRAGQMHGYHIAPTATLLADGRVLVAGGTEGSKPKALESAEVYNPVTASFVETSPMSSARAGHAAVLLTTGEIMVVGGRNGWAPDSADDPPWDPLFADMFDPQSGSFRHSAPMQTTRVGVRAVALADGKVLVLGGFADGLQNIHEQPVNPPYVERYDPAIRQFDALATPRAAHGSFTATLLPDDRLVLIGGFEGDRVVDSVRLLDPATGVLTDAGRLTTPRAGHTATLLADHRILVTGGIDANHVPLASAEISQPIDAP